MRLRRLLLPLAALLGAAIAVLPSIATGTSAPGTASFKAIDFAWQANGGSGSSATIAQGGTVTFAYPSGSSAHNADFGGGSEPTSCAQTAGPSSGQVPPVPNQPTGPGWSGSCTFKTPGTYSFHCDLHPFMTATITVVASPPPTTSTTTTNTTTTSTTTTTHTTTTTSGTTPETTTTGTATTSATPTELPPPPEPMVPVVGPSPTGAASSITVPAIQRGARIRGTVRVTPSGAGSRLDVYVFASPRSLRAHPGHWIRVGRLVRTQLAAGPTRFTVPLGRNVERALRRHSVKVVVGVIVRAPRAATAATIRVIKLVR